MYVTCVDPSACLAVPRRLASTPVPAVGDPLTVSAGQFEVQVPVQALVFPVSWSKR